MTLFDFLRWSGVSLLFLVSLVGRAAAQLTPCVGDCSGDGAVTVDELITLVNIDLGPAQPSACLQGIPSGEAIEIALIIQGVNNALNGCPADEAEAAAEGLDSDQVTSDEAQTLELSLDGTDAATVGNARALVTAEQIAFRAALNVGAALQPATCLTSMTNGASVTYTFNDCAGPRGIMHLTGTLIVVYSVDAAGIHAHATATDLVVNQSTMDIDATATYSVSNGTKTLQVSTSGQGTGPLGNTFTRQGSYVVSWTSTCHTVNGSWTTSRAGSARSTTDSNVTRCDGTCPASGGTITHTYAPGVTLTITYDGSAVASWASTDGKSGTIHLLCIP